MTPASTTLDGLPLGRTATIDALRAASSRGRVRALAPRAGSIACVMPTEAVVHVHRGGPLVALLGNPNCGKPALFNALTGSRQKLATYAGVTVERKEGRLHSAAGSCGCWTCRGATACTREAQTSG